jgi:diaminohydroxyphosphoribosylaminopyrimidine deaminase/5-amino-6-(5-phosphoribosylamino)uracil reductase
MVGCVLVRNEVVVGEGWHKEFGGPHAEVHALMEAGEDAGGCTAYVSLEPCNHHGKTPPCSEALLAAGITRLVYAAPDPGRISGGGADHLRRKGVEVVGPVLLPQEFRKENPAFYYNQVQDSTFVAVKLAQTLDGKIAEKRGQRTTITGPQANFEAHRLRAGFDGIMAGSETLLVDDPFLTVRQPVPMRKPPARVILDTKARLSPKANVFKDVADSPLIIFTGDDASELAIEDLESAGAKVHTVPRSQEGVSMHAVLDACHEMGLRSLFCEGGGTLAWTLMREGLAQRLYLFVAPFVLGAKGVPAFPEAGTRELWNEWSPAFPPASFGRDVLLTLDRMA